MSPLVVWLGTKGCRRSSRHVVSDRGRPILSTVVNANDVDVVFVGQRPIQDEMAAAGEHADIGIARQPPGTDHRRVGESLQRIVDVPKIRRGALPRFLCDVSVDTDEIGVGGGPAEDQPHQPLVSARSASAVIESNAALSRVGGSVLR